MRVDVTMPQMGESIAEGTITRWMKAVGESVREPFIYYRANVAGALSVLEAMRGAGVGRFIFSSTAATYGEPDRTPITEDDATRPTNPYGATKLAIDHAITSYATAYGLAATSLRYFNVAVGVKMSVRYCRRGTVFSFGRERTAYHDIGKFATTSLYRPRKYSAAALLSPSWNRSRYSCMRARASERRLIQADQVSFQVQ